MSTKTISSTRLRQLIRRKLEVEALEDRFAPAAMMAGAVLAPPPAQHGADIQQVAGPQIQVVIPSQVITTVSAPVANGDGTVSITASITTSQGNNSGAALGAQVFTEVVSPGPVTVSASQQFLVGTQVSTSAGMANIVNVAYADWNGVFTSAQFTITYATTSAEPTFTFGALSPNWIGVFNTTAIDQFYNPVVTATVSAPVVNGDGTDSMSVSITTAEGRTVTGPSLGAQLLAQIASVGPVTVSNATQQFLVGTQVSASPVNVVNVAYAAFAPGDSFSSAQFTITFVPTSTEPTFAFGALSPGWMGALNTSALDRFYAQNYASN